MDKPVLCILPQLHAQQLAEIRTLAAAYQVIEAEKDAADLAVPLKNIEVLLGWSKVLGPKIIAEPESKLRWIQAISAGVDYLDLEVLAKKHILLANASGVHSIPIAESVIGMLLCRYRGIQTAIIQQEHHTWNANIPYTELAGQKMLIIGTGHIGQQLASIAQGFAVSVTGVNHTGHAAPNFSQTIAMASIDQYLPMMDIVVNLLPGTLATQHFYNANLFAKMKNGVSFINVGRGATVKTNDLVQALQSGKIGFAGLDVFEEEPLPSDHPLWSMENVLLTPHIAGQAKHFKDRIYAIFKANLVSYLATGKLAQNQVNLSKGY